MKTSTFFALMAEFQAAHIPITEVGKKYFGYSEAEAKRAATLNKYPFPVFRAGSNKSQWIVNTSDLAEYLDECRDKAVSQYKAANV